MMKISFYVFAVFSLLAALAISTAHCLDAGPPLTDCYEHMVPCAPYLGGAAKQPASECCVQARALGEKAKTSPEYSKTLCECFKALAKASGAAAKLYALPHLCRMVVDPPRGKC